MIYTSQPNLLAVDKLVDFIKPTYGPNGKRVLVNGKSLDDGYAIASRFELPDEFDNAIIQLVMEVASKTNERVGDGTTTASILAQSFIKHGITDLGDLKEKLLELARPIKTKDDIERVAFVSFKNREISKTIAEVFHKVGKEGVVTVEESNSLETSHTIVEGMSIDQGYISPYMITNDRQEAILKSPSILVTDQNITSINDIVPFLEKIYQEGIRDLVVIASDISGEALGTLVLNKLRGNLNCLAIKAPGFGDRKKEILEDIAVLTGGQVVSSEKGMVFDKEFLGKASKVVSTKESTVIVGGSGDKSGIKKRADLIRSQIKDSSDFDKEKLEQRLAKLVGGVCVLKVGASTQQEMTSLKYKVEDAVNATRVAIRSGVVRGGGMTLAEIDTGNPNLNEALQAPYQVLRENGVTEVSDDVVDPVEVLIVACESAVSISSTLLSLSGIITQKNGL